MVIPSLSFATRRWIAACLIASLCIVLQIVYATHVSGSVSVTDATRPQPRVITPAILVAVSGTIVHADHNLLGVQETAGAGPVSFLLTDRTLIARRGASVDAGGLQTGDRVQMTIDGRTGHILQLQATPAPDTWTRRVASFGPLAAVALAAAVLLLLVRRRSPRQALAPQIEGRAPLPDSCRQRLISVFG